METMGDGYLMKCCNQIRKIMIFLMVLLYFNSSLWAENVDPLPINDPSTNPAGQQPLEDPWQNPQYVQQHFESNPAMAFEHNPEQAWIAVQQNPALMGSNQKVLDAAFTQDPARAAKVIDGKADLLATPAVLERFDQEAQQNVGLLNDNVKAKDQWYWQKYGIYDKGALITGYSGSTLTIAPSKELLERLKKELADAQNPETTTANKIPQLRTDIRKLEGKSTTFNPQEFRSAKVLEDGSVQVENINIFGSSAVSQSKNSEGKQTINVEGGVVLQTKKESNYFLKVKQGQLILEAADQTNDRPTRVQYRGDFTFEQKKGEYIIKSNCVQKCDTEQLVLRTVRGQTTGFSGEIKLKEGFRADQFILRGNTELVYGRVTTEGFKEEGSRLKVTSKSEVYYTEEKSMQASSFCQQNLKYSCIVNTPGAIGDPRYREQLLFKNIQHGDVVDFRSNHYYNKVRAENIGEGRVSYSSVREKKQGSYEVVSTLVIDQKAGMKGMGNLEKINAGRIDYFFVKNDKEMLQHISSNEFMADKVPPSSITSTIPGNGQFFNNRESKIVTCSVRDDCEDKMARSFGKVIGSQEGSKRISTTIIVAGDHAELAKDSLDWCKKEGCYIVNSRDAPPITNSERLIVTGHHFGNTDYIWRDAPNVLEGKDHSPIDQFYFSDFPKEKNKGQVQEISFSACNTARAPMVLKKNSIEPDLDLQKKYTPEPVYDGFTILSKQYPQMKTMVGQHGTAPYTEKIDELVSSQQEGVIPNTIGALSACTAEGCQIKGYKARYIKLEVPEEEKNREEGKKQERWFWTADGMTCYDLIDPQRKVNCGPMIIASRT